MVSNASRSFSASSVGSVRSCKIRAPLRSSALSALKIFLPPFFCLLLLLAPATALAQAAQADSPDFTLNTTGVPQDSGGTVGGVAQADSPDFTLNTTGVLPGAGGTVGGVAQADSTDFTLNTTGVTPGGGTVGGFGQADSLDFTLDTRSQQAYAKALNTYPNDLFGYTVALSGDTMVIGAPNEHSSATGVNGDGNNASAPFSGAAYVYVRSGNVWIPQAYLKASNTEVSDAFGTSVAISGDTIVVGATGESSSAAGVNGSQTDNSAAEAGAAYIFVRSGTNWTQQAYLKASNPDSSDWFGYSVAISGDTVAIGAPYESSSATGVNGVQTNNSASASGATYVFARSGTNWSQQAYLKASNTGAGDQFGGSVALSSDTVIVGASGEDSNAMDVNGIQGNELASDSGAAYVFVRSGTNWSQQAYLKASNTDAGDQFGFSVSISADTAVVGAVLEDSSSTGAGSVQADNNALDSGAAYVFARTGGNWTKQAYLKASNTGAGDQFGYAVSISGDELVVGAWQEDSNAKLVDGDEANNLAPDAGAGYLFVRSGSAWTQKRYLKASNAGAGDQFGHSVCVSGDTMVVGAPAQDGNGTGIDGDETSAGAPDSGAAYVFVDSGVSPQIIAPPQNQTVSLGNNATFTVGALGSGPLSYQWQFNGANIPDATASSYTRMDAQLTNAGNYSVVVTNNFGGITSAVAALTVLVPPTITAQPQSLTNLAGSTATFSVTASGTAPLSYQWQKDGANLSNGGGIGGAASPVLTLTSAQFSDAGGYAVLVSNSAGSITSAVATLTVVMPPSITIPPQNQTLLRGQDATFTVAALGTPPLSYQWRFNGTDISAATAASLTLLNAQLADAGSYTVVVTNNAGSITSAVATLTVLAPPSITAQPQALTNIAGTTATFSVMAEGTSPLSYQWQKNGTNLSDLGNVSGAGSSVLALTSVQTADEGSYAVVVTNSAGSITSAAVLLTVLVPPSIITQPQNQTLLRGQDAAFTVAALGTPPLSYQWRFNGTDISAATAASFTLLDAQLADAGGYSVVVANSAGSITSAVATLTVLAPITWTNTSGGIWSDAANWSPNTVPGAGDAALITTSGSYTVTLDVNVTVGSLTLGGASGTQAFDVTGRTLTLNGASVIKADGLMALSFGTTLGGAGTLTNQGTLTSSQSTINAPLVNQGQLLAKNNETIGGPFENQAGGLLRPSTIGGQLNVAIGFTNRGTIELTTTIAGVGAALVVSSGSLVNAPGGQINVLPGAGGTRDFHLQLDNQGTMTINQTLTMTPNGANHLNSGTINLIGGDLGVSQFGGSSPFFTFTTTGTIDIPSGRIFAVQNGGTLNYAGGTIGGAGTLYLDAVTANFTPDFTNQMPTTLLLIGTILNGPGKVTNPAGSTLTPAQCTINTALVNQGLLNALANNIFNGPFENQTNATLQVSRGGGGLTVTNGFTNSGTIEMMTTVANVGIVLTVGSGGLVNAPGGQINVLPGAGGPRELQARLDNQGTLTINQTLTMTPNGANHLNSGTINLIGGDLWVTQFGGSPPFFTFTSTGTIDIRSGRTFAIAPGRLDNLAPGIIQGNGTLDVSGSPFLNSGQVNPGASPGKLTVMGGFPQTAAGTLNIELGGTSPGTDFDLLAVSGAATLGGTLNVTLTNGFIPAINSTFTFLTSASRSGAFTTFNYPSSDFEMQVSYTPTNATIQVISVLSGPPIITAQPQSRTNVVGTTAAFSVSATGAAPLSYQWQKDGTNLSNVGSVSGATSSALALANVQLTGVGNYTLTVTNIAGSVTSTVATLTVTTPTNPLGLVTFQVDMQTAAFNPGLGDTVEARGSFNGWSGGFTLAADAGRPGIYTNIFNIPGTNEESVYYKFVIANGGNANWEGFANDRTFQLATNGQILPLVYFNDLAPASGGPRHSVTFRVNMSAQIVLGRFNPATDTVGARGTFQSPDQWSGGFQLTDSGVDNIFVGTYANDGNYEGGLEEFKFVITSGGNDIWESIGNRPYILTNGMTLPVVYFDNLTAASPVTFQVDLSTAPFNPGLGDTIEARGSFNGWSGGFTLVADAARPNVFTNTANVGSSAGDTVYYKFVIANAGGDNWEGFENDRRFTLATGGQTLPLVFFNDLAPASGGPRHSVTFRVNMSTQIALGHFNPATDTVGARGTFQSPDQWSGGFQLTDGGVDNIFVGTYSNDRNYEGGQEEFKFVISSGANDTWESIGNRVFILTDGMTLPVVYFNNQQPAQSTPAVLTSPGFGTGSQFQFTITGTTGANYVIQTSTDLAESNWVSVFTNAAPFTFTDPQAGTSPQRFYRAVYLP